MEYATNAPGRAEVMRKATLAHADELLRRKVEDIEARSLALSSITDPSKRVREEMLLRADRLDAERSAESLRRLHARNSK